MAQSATMRYAAALFNLACERDRVDEYLSAANAFAALESDGAFMSFFNDPRVANGQKSEFIKKIFGANLPDDFYGLISVALTKRREGEIFSIIKAFIALVKEHKNIEDAEITSAVPFTEKQLADVTAVLSRKLGKNVVVTTKIDKSVVAGFSVRVKGKLIDATVATGLSDMKNSLLSKTSVRE